VTSTVKVLWWYRWQEFEKAKAARLAWDHYKSTDKPTDLSPDEQALIAWSRT